MQRRCGRVGRWAVSGHAHRRWIGEHGRDLGLDFDGDDPKQLAAAGDLGPEGLVFVDASDSPSGTALLIVGNEVSGSTTIYEVYAL